MRNERNIAPLVTLLYLACDQSFHRSEESAELWVMDHVVRVVDEVPGGGIRLKLLGWDKTRVKTPAFIN
jgi:hypothetical protein